MVDEKITIQNASEVDPNLLRILDRGFEDVNNLYSSDFMIYLLSTSMGLDPVKDKNLLDKLLDMIKLINSNTKDMLYLSVFEKVDK